MLQSLEHADHGTDGQAAGAEAWTPGSLGKQVKQLQISTHWHSVVALQTSEQYSEVYWLSSTFRASLAMMHNHLHSNP